MRVLFFYSSPIIPNRGGVQNVAFSIADYLLSKGFEIYFLSSEYNEENEPNYFSFPDTHNINSKINTDFAISLISQFSIDIVINLDGLNSNVLSFFSKLKIKNSFKLFNVIHNTFLPQNYIYYKYLKYFFKPFYLFIFYCFKQFYYYKLDKCSDKIILFSRSSLVDLKYFKKNRKFINKVCFIPNPIKISNINPSSSKDNSFIFVGRLDENQKHLTFLLELWSRLCFKYPDWNLFILGTGKDLILMKEFSFKFGLINVKFLGNVDPTKYYISSKFLLLTSRFEGWPMVIPEAMNYACIPCVVNSFTSLKDMIVDGYNGYLLNEFDINENVEILEKLINNSNHFDIKQNCIDTSKKYSMDIVGLKWLEILNT